MHVPLPLELFAPQIHRHHAPREVLETFRVRELALGFVVQLPYLRAQWVVLLHLFGRLEIGGRGDRGDRIVSKVVEEGVAQEALVSVAVRRRQVQSRGQRVQGRLRRERRNGARRARSTDGGTGGGSGGGGGGSVVVVVVVVVRWVHMARRRGSVVVVVVVVVANAAAVEALEVVPALVRKRARARRHARGATGGEGWVWAGGQAWVEGERVGAGVCL